MHCEVIAEAASCHDGSLGNAIEMISQAADAGADVVKFQFWSDADRLAGRRKVGDHYREIYRRYQMPATWLPELARHCETMGVEFMCTTYLPEDIEVVAPFVKRFKVSSFEAGDSEFLAAHGDRPVILSTGMMDIHGVKVAVRNLRNCHSVLHCVSAYPCRPPDLALLFSWSLRAIDGRGYLIGLSDHTAHNLTGALAVAAGAQMIEVHFRHPDTDKANPDYAVAVPDLAEYVRLVRFAEQYRGSGIKHQTAEEAAMAKHRVVS